MSTKTTTCGGCGDEVPDSSSFEYADPMCRKCEGRIASADALADRYGQGREEERDGRLIVTTEDGDEVEVCACCYSNPCYCQAIIDQAAS